MNNKQSKPLQDHAAVCAHLLTLNSLFVDHRVQKITISRQTGGWVVKAHYETPPQSGTD